MAKHKLIWYTSLGVFSACLSILIAEIVQIHPAFALCYLGIIYGAYRIFQGNQHPAARDGMAANLGKGKIDYGWCLLIAFTGAIVGGGSSWLLWIVQQLFS
ncbi:MAG: hypothetical protein F6K08_22920 [Okeania sp. SIO1H6]|nr:hypothetical protein [Okeania sp. SIO1H6]